MTLTTFFVLQVSGSKRWTIFGTPVESPLPAQEYDAELHPLGPVTLEFELQPGDVAYIPRGVAHEAKSTDTVSLHITTGILRYTWTDLLLETIAATSLSDPAFRKALPPQFLRTDFDREAARARVRELLQRAADDALLDTVLDGLIDRFLDRCPPVLDGQMEQLDAVSSITLDSAVCPRSGVIWRLETEGSSTILRTYGRRIIFPIHAGESLRFALGGARFTIRNLPGDLDDAGKLTLARRLVREGMLRVEIPTR